MAKNAQQASSEKPKTVWKCGDIWAPQSLWAGGQSGNAHTLRVGSFLRPWNAMMLTFLLACSLQTHSEPLHFSVGREPGEM